MSICPEYQDLMAGVVDETLSPEEQARAEQHLSMCVRCASEVRELRATRRLLAALPQEETSPLFVPRLRERLAAPPPSVWGRLAAWTGEPRLALQLAAAGAAVLLVVGAVTWRHMPVPPQPNRNQSYATQPYSSGDPELDAFVQECISRHESNQANRMLWHDADHVMAVASQAR